MQLATGGLAGRVAVGLLGVLAIGCRDVPEVSWEAASQARQLGLGYLEEQRLPDAAEEFDRLSRMAVHEPLGPANLAVTEFRRGDLEAAGAAVREALQRAPRAPRVLVIAAIVEAESGDTTAATGYLRSALQTDSANVSALWMLYELRSDSEALSRIVAIRPGNLLARLAAAEAGLLHSRPEAALPHLEVIEQLLAPGGSEARSELRLARSASRAGQFEAALRHVRILHNLLRVDPLYAAALRELRGGSGARIEPITRFLRLSPPVRRTDDGQALGVRFIPVGDATPGWTGAVATDIDGDGDLDLVGSDGAALACRANEAARWPVRDCAEAPLADMVPVQAVDFDGDARADLLLAGPGGVAILYAGPEGTFEARSGSKLDSRPVWTAASADFDHDGDLDVLAGGPGPARMFRQTIPLSFERAGEGTGLAEVVDVTGIAFGDVDVDGDLDVVLAATGGTYLMSNLRNGRFEPAREWEMTGAPVLADLDNDGWFDLALGVDRDLFVAKNGGDLGFEELAAAVVSGPGGERKARGGSLLVEDLDLDGNLDALTVPSRGYPFVYRGVGDGRFVSSPAALDLPAAGETADGTSPTTLVAFDADGDGDLDLAVGRSSSTRMFRNEGGERNHALAVSLLALADGSGKVNRLGIGSRLDVWAGATRQSRVVRHEVERFGLGRRDSADVVRIEWTNGVPQNVFGVQARQRLVETQVLKGSCAFLYAWNGSGYEFVTDMLWKSALGMPLGIMAGDVAYAPPDPSLEYVRVPPEAVRVRDGAYEFRITEELWEVAFLDQLRLLVVDHPQDVELYVNEAFGPPTRPNERIFATRSVRAPEAADAGGYDVRETLAARDFDFVGGFDPGPVQGITALHDLTLTLRQAAGRPARLYLGGWIYPTDASINVKLGQAGEPTVVRPYVEVPDGRGGWRRLDVGIDFPSGKNKTVIVELPDGLPVADPRLRIRTNMEIYWDVAFYTTDLSDPELVRRSVSVAFAHLTHRGFSRMYRRGGRYGPQWFDYDDTTSASPWRPLPGRYTRLGDVRELLGTVDDRYVVFGPGDEIAVRFEAPPPPPSGWRRTLFVYSDGFLKDADLNTRGGGRVGPFPVHGQESYAEPGVTNTETASFRAFADRYLTRHVPATAPAVRPPPSGHSR